MSEVNKNQLHKNSMQAKFTIQEPEITYSNSDKVVDLEVPKRKAWKHTMVDIGVGEDVNSDINVEIGNLKDHKNDKEAQIYVSGRNCMQAVFDIQVPPIIETGLPADMDSYTISTPPRHIENFGDTNTMHVQYSEEVRDAYIYFHLPLWYLETMVFSTKLRLYYRGTMTGKEKLRLMENRREWHEYGITHENAPPVRKDLTKEYTINFEERYIEFDVYDVVEEWRKYPELNYGFRLSTDEEYRISFFTRETPLKPLLVTEHYDPQVRYTQRIQRTAEITIGNGADSEKEVQIEPATTWRDVDREVIVKAYTYGDTIYEEEEVELIVNKRQVNVQIAAGINRDEERDVELSARVSWNSLKEVSLTVNKVQIPVELGVIINGDSNVETEITAVPNDNKEVIVSVGKHSDKETSIEIKGFKDNVTPVDLAVTRKTTEVELTAMQHGDSDIPVVIYPKGWAEDSVNTVLNVIRKSIEVELTAVQHSDSDIPVEIRPKVWEYNQDPNVELVVNRKETLVRIRSAILHSAKETWIRASIPKESDAPVEITASIHDNKHVEFEVTPNISKHAEIAVTRNKAEVEIGVLANGSEERLVEITPRIRATSNPHVIIIIGTDMVGYVYLM